MRPVLIQLGEARRALERLREAEACAERLNDDRRRGRVFAFETTTYTLLGEVDKALAAGIRARMLAQAAGDLDLRIPTTTSVEQAHYFRGDYEQVVELATDNLALLPAERAHDYFGSIAPASVYDRYWLILSLAPLGRFAEAAQYEAEAARLAEPTQHPYTIGIVHLAASTLHLLKGDWAEAHSRIEKGLAVFRGGHVGLLLPRMVASSAWVLAQLGETREALNRLQEADHLLESHTARGLFGMLGWSSVVLGHASLLLGRVDQARGLADRAVGSSRDQHGVVGDALHLLGDIAIHPDRFNAENAEAHYIKALALAEPRGMRPLIAHCHLGLGKLYRRTGRREQAQEHLATATAMYRDMGMTYWREKAEAELGEIA